VRHAQPHVEPGIDACGNCTTDISNRIVQQHFGVTDMNADGWHPGKVTVEGRSQWMFRVGASQIGMHERLDLRAREEGIGIRARVIGRARQGFCALQCLSSAVRAASAVQLVRDLRNLAALVARSD
jgi:hypothetical protein